MGHKYQVRVIKQGQKERPVEAEMPATAGRTEPTEREMRTVVSDWVREHRQRTDEYRRTFAGLLRQVGFNPLPATKRS